MFDCQKVLALATENPAQALVRLFVELRDQPVFETGLNRGRLERQAELVRQALEAGDPPPEAHPLAALRGIDLFLAEVVDLNHEPRVRRIELTEGNPHSAYFVVPRRPGWSSRFAATQAGHLEYWLRRHQIVPARHRGIDVTVRPLPTRLWQALEDATLSFLAGGFSDGVAPDWTDREGALHCSCLGDAPKRWASVEALLEQAVAHNARVVVLPELTVDSNVAAAIRRWLATNHSPFALVAAGSFHEDHETPAGGAGRRSISRLYDPWGDPLLSHVKLRPMRAMPGGVVVDEHLDAGHAVDLLRAPFGLLAVAICLDYCESGSAAVSDLWRELGPALVLVPSMGTDSTNNAHAHRARELVLQHSTATVVASQHPSEPTALGLCWMAAAQDAGDPVVAFRGTPVLIGAISWTLA